MTEYFANSASAVVLALATMVPSPKPMADARAYRFRRENFQDRERCVDLAQVKDYA
jgi:hypothetical protein